MSAKPFPYTIPWPTTLAPTYGPYRATLDRWIDGDTGLFLVDLGFGRYEYVEIRVSGLKCADDPHPEAAAAKTYAEHLLKREGRVRLHTYAKMKSTFSRWVASIELEHGLDFALAMTAAGHHRPDLSR